MSGVTNIQWTWFDFEEISGLLMHEILSLRQRVFVVEQQCICQDADELDRQSLHLVGNDSSGRVVAYARVNKPGSRFAESSLGRVVTAPGMRGRGVARQAITLCIEKCSMLYPDYAIKISAQLYLVDFYRSLGFKILSEPYDEDGIDHIDMMLRSKES